MTETTLQDRSRLSPTRTVAMDREETVPSEFKGAYLATGRSRAVRQEVVNQDGSVTVRGETVPAENVSAPTISQEPEAATPAQAPKSTQVALPRVKVQLSGSSKDSKHGRTTLFCSGVAISESLVVLQYPEDGQTTIVEPASCLPSDPIIVNHNGAKYRCMYDNWSVSLGGHYLVMLVRLPDAD
jgi:hypothetical protein